MWQTLISNSKKKNKMLTFSTPLLYTGISIFQESDFDSCHGFYCLLGCSKKERKGKKEDILGWKILLLVIAENKRYQREGPHSPSKIKLVH